jgi:hypothetical protein
MYGPTAVPSGSVSKVMEKEQKERLAKVAAVGIVIALGSRALKKDFPEESRVKSVRFLEASKSLWMEIIDFGTQTTVKFVSTIKSAEDGSPDLASVEPMEDQEFSEDQVKLLEKEFPSSLVDENNTLQNQ